MEGHIRTIFKKDIVTREIPSASWVKLREREDFGRMELGWSREDRVV